MNRVSKISKKTPYLLYVVALLEDVPEKSLASGQVRPYAITPVPQTQLLVLHYVPEAA
jgi:hypothetical protein